MSLAKRYHNEFLDPFFEPFDRMVNNVLAPFASRRGPLGWDEGRLSLDDNLARHPIQTHTYDDGTFNVNIDVPGLTKDDIDMQLNEETGVLSVSSVAEEKNENSYSSRRINYQVTLPDGYDPKSLDATVKDGLLTVKGKKPKEKENKSLRRIKVK